MSITQSLFLLDDDDSNQHRQIGIIGIIGIKDYSTVLELDKCKICQLV